MKPILALLVAFAIALSLAPARAAEQKPGDGLKKFTGMVVKYDPAKEITLAKKKQRFTCIMGKIPMKGNPKVDDVVSVTYETVEGKRMCRSIVVEMPAYLGGGLPHDHK
jgi:hypothetical protein